MQTLWILLLIAVFSISYGAAKVRPHPKSSEHVHCFTEHELAESSEKVVEQFVGHRMDWKSYSAVQLVKELENNERRKRRKRTPQTSCPNFDIISKAQSNNERSISPWTYRIDVDENRFPQKLAFAECLCKHCINIYTGKESSALDSFRIEQKMLVLQKEVCPRPKEHHKFTFRLKYIPVPVACTCILPRY